MKDLLTVKQTLGFLFGVMCGMSLVLNMIALISVFRLAFVLRKNQVYIIAFFNILSDVLQMALSTFYLAPSIILDSFIVSSKKKDDATLFLGSMFMFFWYFETITQVIFRDYYSSDHGSEQVDMNTAAQISTTSLLFRFVVICLQKHKLFTFASTLFIFILLIPFCFFTMYISQYVNPCCSFLFDQEYLSYSYYTIEGVPNYSNDFDLPLNAMSSIISGICYILIFWTVHKTTPTFSSANEANKLRRNRDIKYAIQFCLILVFYVFVWVLFRVLPVALQNRHVEWFILVPSFYTINCTSNALIYLCFNSEVQNNVRPKKVRSILLSLGLSQGYSATPTQTLSMTSVTNFSRANFEPSRPVVFQFTGARRLPPFRSIGLNVSTPI